MISINIDKAKDIWRNILRVDRIPYLENLDIEFMRAVESGDINKQKEIANKKQILRDAPNDPRIDNVNSTDKLLQINPIKELGL